MACCAPGYRSCVSLWRRRVHRRAVQRTPTILVTEEVRKYCLTEHLGITTLLLAANPKRSLNKHYEVLDLLGEGGFGSVHRARDRRTDEERAIKRIPKTQCVGDADRLFAELESMVRLNHPNILRLYEFFEDRGGLYLVMELCTDGHFGEFILERHEDDELRLCFLDLMLAVAYCHDQGVVHRDLKFENCLLQRLPERRTTKVIDFGLAAIWRPASNSATSADSFTKEMLGTRYFMAPEVIGNRLHGCPCDCWSAGVMLYIVLTDEHPCLGSGSLCHCELAKNIQAGHIRWGLLHEEGVSENCVALLKQLLVVAPERRISARAVLASPWLQESRHSRYHHKLSTVSRSSRVARLLGELDHARSFGGFSRFEKALLTLVAHERALGAERDLRTAFSRLDFAGEGSLSKDEFIEGLRNCGQLLSPEESDALFRAIDIDRSGRILYYEWLAATMNISSLNSKKAITHAFEFFDLDGDGLVSAQELSQILGEDVEIAGLLSKDSRENTEDSRLLDVDEFSALAWEFVRRASLQLPEGPGRDVCQTESLRISR